MSRSAKPAVLMDILAPAAGMTTEEDVYVRQPMILAVLSRLQPVMRTGSIMSAAVRVTAGVLQSIPGRTAAGYAIMMSGPATSWTAPAALLPPPHPQAPDAVGKKQA